jgi:hypothetical protein
MFDLEKSIAEWRKRLQAAGIKSPVPLDELEIHLRDEIERQVKSGLNPQPAFELAVQNIGQARVLRSEFKKSERTHLKKPMLISLGILAVLLGTAFVLPAIAKYQLQGAFDHDVTFGLLIGMPITLAGLGAAFCGFKKRRA